MHQSSPPAQFHSRIGRRLSLVFAGFIAIVLVVGGVCLALAIRIQSTNDLVNQENIHINAIDQLQSNLRVLTFEIDEMQDSGQFDRIGRLQNLHQGFRQSLEKLRALHQGDKDSPDGNESAVLSDLEKLASDLQVFIDAVTIGPGRMALLGMRSPDWFNSISRRMSEIAEDISKTHRARIARLVQSSEGMVRAIVALYVGFILAGGVLIALISWAANKSIAAPLRTLADAALGIAEGRLDERVPVRSENEIGQLSHAFNVMADRLQSRERDLLAAHQELEQKVRETQALYEIGTEITSLHDLDRILQSVVEKARGLLRVEAAALCLTSPGQEEMQVRATSGPPDASLSGDLFTPCMSATDKGTAPSSRSCPATCPGPRPGFLTAPLRQGDALIGRICVAGREPREFTAAETDFLTGLATQAAVAIENARLYEEVRSLAMLEERDRLARELHDGLAQALALLNLKLDRLQDRAASARFPQVVDAVQEMAWIAALAYEDLRQSIFGLRTKVPRELGLIPSLSKYLHEFSVQNEIAVNFTADDDQAIRLPPASEVQLIRIVQEALANVRKHSGGRQARVGIECEDSLIHVTIIDDGRGFDPATLIGTDRRHFGLQTMRERAESVGGKLEIITGPGRGTRIVVTLPQEA